MKIVTHGKCTNCGEPIKDNGLFLCKKCRLINKQEYDEKAKKDKEESEEEE